jgi:hypothetical protein
MFSFNKITLSLLLSVTIIIGALGFSFIDKYPLVDALYMSVITITTVGFGEIYPLSEWGRLFTVVLISLGFVGHYDCRVASGKGVEWECLGEENEETDCTVGRPPYHLRFWQSR